MPSHGQPSRILVTALVSALASSVVHAELRPGVAEPRTHVASTAAKDLPPESDPAESVAGDRTVNGFDLDYPWCVNELAERRLSSDLEFLKLRENCDVMHSHAAAGSSEAAQDLVRIVDSDSCRALRAHYVHAARGTVEATVAISDILQRLQDALTEVAASRAAYTEACISGGRRLARRSSSRLMDAEERMQTVLSELMDVAGRNTRYDGRMFERYVSGASMYVLYSLGHTLGMYPDVASGGATIAAAEDDSKARSGDTIVGMRSLKSSASFSPIRSWWDVVNWLSANRIFEGRTTGIEMQLERSGRLVVIKFESDQITKSHGSPMWAWSGK